MTEPRRADQPQSTSAVLRYLRHLRRHLGRPLRASAPLAVGALAFVVNPNVGCSLEPDFDYSEKEMAAAVEGTWQATGTLGDAPISFTFKLEQATTKDIPPSGSPIAP